MVAWTSYSQDGSDNGVYAQRYLANGSAASLEFRVNKATVGEQTSPVIASLASGDFILTCKSNGQDGSGKGVYAQRYTPSGMLDGVEFRVNTTTISYQGSPAIAALPDNRFLTVWVSDTQGVYVQRYNASGAVVGSEFLINTNQFTQRVSFTNDGCLLVVGGTYSQSFTADGKTVQFYLASTPIPQTVKGNVFLK